MRPLDRLLALVLGLALAAAGIVAVVEISLLLADGDPWLVNRSAWDTELRELSWDDGAVTLGLAIALAAAALVLVVQLVPRNPARLAVREGRDDREVWISRRGLQDRLRQRAESDPDVVRSSVKVTRRRARVDAHLPSHAARREARQRLSGELRRSLEEVGLERTPKLRVQVRQGETKARVR